MLAGALAALAICLGLSGGDLAAHSWVVGHRSSLGVRSAIVITMLGSSGVAISAVFVAALILTRGGVRTRLMCAVVLVAVMACAISCRYGLSVLVARDRPPQADWAYHAWGYAFPSGHAFDAALAAGLTGLLLGRRLDSHPVARAAGWAAVIVYAVAVAATRLYLGVHWPSDILGSWVFAALWLAAAAWLAGKTRRPRPFDPSDSAYREHTDSGRPEIERSRCRHGRRKL
jgi:membrane-associated phospholipid phosphatase